MLLDPETLDLAPRAPEVLERVRGDDRFKLELPAAQLEIMLPPRATVAEAAADLADARQSLAEATAGLVRPAAAGVHPFADRRARSTAANGTSGRSPSTARLPAGSSWARSRCMWPCAVPSAHSPYTTACAGTCRSSPPSPRMRPSTPVRTPALPRRDRRSPQPLPRQGLPPPIASWEDLAGALRWGAAAAVVPEPRRWWWELRPHPLFGTLELRVPTPSRRSPRQPPWRPSSRRSPAGSPSATTPGRCCPTRPRGGSRRTAGRPPGAVWRARWRTSRRARAQRRGRGSSSWSMRSRPTARGLGCGDELDAARELAQTNGAMRQREVARDRGLRGLVAVAGRRVPGAAPAGPAVRRPAAG